MVSKHGRPTGRKGGPAGQKRVWAWAPSLGAPDVGQPVPPPTATSSSFPEVSSTAPSSEIDRLTAALTVEQARRRQLEVSVNEQAQSYADDIAALREAVAADLEALHHQLDGLRQELEAKNALIAYMKGELTRLIGEMRRRPRPTKAAVQPESNRDDQETSGQGVELYGAMSRFSALSQSALVDKRLPEPESVRKPEIREMLTFLRDKGVEHIRLRGSEIVTVHKVAELARLHGWGQKPLSPPEPQS